LADEPTGRNVVLTQIRTPLVFFALSLLIIEGIFALVVIKSQLTGDQQFYSLFLMAGLFLAVVACVAVLTVMYPDHLYDRVLKVEQEAERATAILEQMHALLATEAFRDRMEDIIREILEAEGANRPEK